MGAASLKRRGCGGGETISLTQKIRGISTRKEKKKFTEGRFLFRGWSGKIKDHRKWKRGNLFRRASKKMPRLKKDKRFSPKLGRGIRKKRKREGGDS